jgi:hypothetical protein
LEEEWHLKQNRDEKPSAAHRHSFQVPECNAPSRQVYCQKDRCYQPKLSASQVRAVPFDPESEHKQTYRDQQEPSLNGYVLDSTDSHRKKNAYE